MDKERLSTIEKISVPPREADTLPARKRRLEQKMWSALSHEEKVEYIRLHKTVREDEKAEKDKRYLQTKGRVCRTCPDHDGCGYLIRGIQDDCPMLDYMMYGYETCQNETETQSQADDEAVRQITAAVSGCITGQVKEAMKADRIKKARSLLKHVIGLLEEIQSHNPPTDYTEHIRFLQSLSDNLQNEE